MNNTSNNLDKPISPAMKRMLFSIKTKGPIATADLAKALDMTGEAARQLVQKLLENHWIEGEQLHEAQVGRPKQSWVISEAGNRFFPDNHAYLTVQLLQSVEAIFGAAGLEKLITERENLTLIQYQAACVGPSVEEKITQLANIRTEEGYMAQVQVDGLDYLLIENHCPICAAAQKCQQFCRSELQLFQQVLGQKTKVTREQHLLNQAQRCVYRIRLLT